jgi:hypothetical protein
LRARYAQRDKNPEQQSFIEPFGPDRLQMIINFVPNAAAVGAAVTSAVAAIIAANTSLRGRFERLAAPLPGAKLTFAAL